ncbi:DNA topoisomerase 1 [Lithohypha guttulata]|uniref:DNA topoisomerase I n=1 Tax=Lithohypha guttulata TaxID=1690604 RepID=A0AAN7T4A7_9EURO|nr:DNA topoisomerase 1 [Lithohypha guttulata]KAK5088442.1 DNA topoisomerase 1 [Lithohypha guttulata]
MSSSDDDMPLVASRRQPNGVNGAHPPLSASTVSPKTDAAVGKKPSTNGNVMPAMPKLEEEDVAMNDIAPATNGAKRRTHSNRPSFAEPESSDDDKPLSKKRKTQPRPSKALETDSDDEPLAAKSNGLPTKAHTLSAGDLGENSDSDTPLTTKLAEQKQDIMKKAEKTAKAIKKEEAKEVTKKPASKSKKVKKEDSSDDEPLSRKSKTASASKAKQAKTEPSASKTTAKGKAKAVKKEETEDPEDGEEGEEEMAWWNNPMHSDGENKWATLQHSGVVFPPPYQPLPKNVKLKYDGAPVSLHPDAEEVASFFGGMLNSTHNVENPTFQKNFFADFKEILKKTGGATGSNGDKVAIKEFSKCDFKPIFEYYDAQREAKKSLSKEEKKKIKAEKDEAEAPYQFCLWDGKKQKVGNFRVEPPGLFRGRGDHPKTGKVKTRVQPEQITINIGKEATVPAPPEGHKWKEVKHDRTGTWLAMWQENINGNFKYVMLAANSDIKGRSDFEKFEKARRLKGKIDDIRSAYRRDLKAEMMVDRQRATAMYLIDTLALRAGNEKGEDEADTVGCCSLKYENITLQEPSTVIFDFLGKDSIRFHESYEVDKQVFKNLKIFKKAPKKEGDQVFDRLTTTALNKHLSNLMPGLTAKVFRTYNASWTFAQLLKDIKPGGTVAEQVKNYNDANRKVAILCNHRRTVGATHAASMEKMEDRIKAVKYQAWRIKQMMIDVDPKIKKKKGADWFELPEGIDQEWVLEHQAFLIEEQKTKITRKFEKDNEKLKSEGEKEMKSKELTERLEAVKELEQKFKKENKSKKVEAEGKSPTLENLQAKLEKVEQRAATMETQALDKESNKEVALGTSKINYIDPRLTVVFCKRFNVPIEKFFSKTLREKFQWAVESTTEDWDF